MLELLIAEGIFSYRLKRRKGFAWKASLCILACLGIAFALPILSYHSASDADVPPSRTPIGCLFSVAEGEASEGEISKMYALSFINILFPPMEIPVGYGGYFLIFFRDFATKCPERLALDRKMWYNKYV